MIPTEHHARMSLHVVIPDGVYVPLERPLTDDERDGQDDSTIATAEIAIYLREKLAAIGVTVQTFGITEHYTLQAPQKGIA